MDSHEYMRCDNAADATNPYVDVHWRIRIKQPYPQRWSVLLGDVLTNLRAVLDHTLWAAVVKHSGPPAQPHRIQFPIATKANKFQQAAAELRPLVTPDVWELVDAIQPFHGGSQAHTSPLEILRWLCNVDKHRALHIVGRTAFDLAPVIVRSAIPLDIVEQWRHEGPVEDNIVVARLKVRRPVASAPIDLYPTFAHLPTLQIRESPVEYRSVASLMPAMNEQVLRVLTYTTALLGEPMPDEDSLELGAEHEAVAAEHGGNIAIVRQIDGTVHRMSLDRPLV